MEIYTKICSVHKIMVGSAAHLHVHVHIFICECIHTHLHTVYVIVSVDKGLYGARVELLCRTTPTCLYVCV